MSKSSREIWNIGASGAASGRGASRKINRNASYPPSPTPSGSIKNMATAKKTTKPQETVPAVVEESVATVKGFNLDWTCRDFKFEIGQTYEHKGSVAACESG